MTNNANSNSGINTLKQVFSDQPDLLTIITLGDVESERLLETYQEASGMFATHVNQYVVGRTYAGKTSLGNMLFGKEVMHSSGYMNCTYSIGQIRMKSNLWYFDTPGAGDNEEFENVTRAALMLKQLDKASVTSFEIQDFTEAKKQDDGKTTDIVVQKVELDNWTKMYYQEFSPDVILYTVAPHMLFLPGDKAYFEALLRVHAEKIVIVLNIWFKDGARVTTPQNIEDTKSKISQIYERLFPDHSITPHFVEVNALTGAGINELTIQICRIVPQEKLGNIQVVLRDDLKNYAKKERDIRFQHTLNRIAARLALYTIDTPANKAENQDLISAAASGVAQYSVMTFNAADVVSDMQRELETLIDQQKAATEIRRELDAFISQQIDKIKQQRTQVMTEKSVVTEPKIITEQIPITKNEMTTIIEPRVEKQQTVTRIPKDSVTRSLLEAEGLVRKGIAFLQGKSQKDFDAIDTDIHDRSFVKRLGEETVVTNVPVTKEVEKFVGFETKVVGTHDVVVAVTEKVIGQRALEGGFPVIEFLISLGLGIKQYCRSASDDTDAQVYVSDMQQVVQLKLGPFKSQLEQFIKQGGSSEAQIIQLLDTKLTNI